MQKQSMMGDNHSSEEGQRKGYAPLKSHRAEVWHCQYLRLKCDLSGAEALRWGDFFSMCLYIYYSKLRATCVWQQTESTRNGGGEGYKEHPFVHP